MDFRQKNVIFHVFLAVTCLVDLDIVCYLIMLCIKVSYFPPSIGMKIMFHGVWIIKN